MDDWTSAAALANPHAIHDLRGWASPCGSQIPIEKTNRSSRRSAESGPQACDLMASRDPGVDNISQALVVGATRAAASTARQGKPPAFEAL